MGGVFRPPEQKWGGRCGLGQKRVDLFVKLLAAIAKKVGYNFNVAEMNRIYFPRARRNDRGRCKHHPKRDGGYV